MNFFSFVMVAAMGWAESPARISTVSKDLGRVDQIYLAPGLVSVVDMPSPVLEARVGDPKSLKVSISSVSANEVTLILGNSQASATNLIVRTDRRTFVFDVIPSKTNHQDYVKIRGTFSGYGRQGSSDTVIRVIGPQKPTPAGVVVEQVSLGGS